MRREWGDADKDFLGVGVFGLVGRRGVKTG
jgi:hypothetical protein